MPEKKRIEWIDVAKGITLLFIINTHFPNKSMLFPWGYAFHVIAFFVLSGYLMGIKNEVSYSPGEMLLRKWKAIGYPYVMLSVAESIYLFIYWLFHGQIAVSFTVLNIELSICGFGVGTLWFLSSLFFGELLVYLFLKKFPKPISGILIGIVALLGLILAKYMTELGLTDSTRNVPVKMALIGYFPLFLIRTMIAAGAIYIGYLWQKVSKIQFLSDKKWVLAVFAIGFVLIYAKWIGPALSHNNLKYASINKPLFYVFGTLFGTAAVVLFSYCIECVPYLSKGLQWIGTHSLIIMTTHYDFKIVQIVYDCLNRLGLHYNQHKILFGLSMFAVILPIEVLLVYIIEHTPFRYLYQMPKLKKKEGTDSERKNY